jgi:excisionase family DNA binding protein
MNEPVRNPFDAILEAFRQIVREEITARDTTPKELLTAKELANRLKLPLSWVYEQSRQGNIPTHRLGRYIRFDFQEVLTQKKN